MYGHVEKLAEQIKKGASSVEGVEAKLWQVPETLPEEVLTKMSAPPKSDVPIIMPGELAEADGFVFGFPTRFGMMAAQFKAFLDATGGLWRTQQLAGKPAGIFYSTGSQGGGQENYYCVDRHYPAGSPWHDLCAHRLHFWSRDVRDGKSERRKSLWCGNICR
ncbi:Quinone reductase family protein [Actinidia rufa]|uniref:NAD(P)H dehydrogenase (quinone) n=1 Tax=Actinidia rufa TaxID=165716 RepID=A0A7J0G9U4_9ERIC|nr:Quinone reductase family protein [Actinidia rufa]